MCEWGHTTLVPTPDWAASMRQRPESGIAIDSCIVANLVDAWARGVRTLGSCCGHGREAPNVVLTQDPEQVDLARSLLSGWTLYQWQLVDVSQPVVVERAGTEGS